MREMLSRIKSDALAQINADNADLEQIRVKYLGKKGELTAVLRGMGQLTPEERPIIGQLANEVRAEIEEAIGQRNLPKRSLMPVLRQRSLTLPCPAIRQR